MTNSCCEQSMRRHLKIYRSHGRHRTKSPRLIAIDLAAAPCLQTPACFPPTRSRTMSRRKFSKQAIAARRLIIARCPARQPVGFALTSRRGTADLDQNSVHPPAMPAWNGAVLVDRVSPKARVRKLRCVTLPRSRTSPGTAPFYRRMGFREIARPKTGRTGCFDFGKRCRVRQSRCLPAACFMKRKWGVCSGPIAASSRHDQFPQAFPATAHAPACAFPGSAARRGKHAHARRPGSGPYSCIDGRRPRAVGSLPGIGSLSVAEAAAAAAAASGSASPPSPSCSLYRPRDKDAHRAPAR